MEKRSEDFCCFVCLHRQPDRECKYARYANCTYERVISVWLLAGPVMEIYIYIIYLYNIYAQWTGWIAIALGGYLSYINAVYRVRMWPVDIHLEDITSQFEWLATKHAFLIARKNSHLHTEQFIRIRLICG